MVENPIARPELGLFLLRDFSNLVNTSINSPFIHTQFKFASVFAFLTAHFLGHLAHLLTLPSTTSDIKRTLDFFLAYSP
jgi:hypothetical protein